MFWAENEHANVWIILQNPYLGGPKPKGGTQPGEFHWLELPKYQSLLRDCAVKIGIFSGYQMPAAWRVANRRYHHLLRHFLYLIPASLCEVKMSNTIISLTLAMEQIGCYTKSKHSFLVPLFNGGTSRAWSEILMSRPSLEKVEKTRVFFETKTGCWSLRYQKDYKK